MNTFIFFVSVGQGISQTLNRDMKYIQSRGHEILLKVAEVERPIFEFFGIKYVPTVVVFKDNVSIKEVQEYDNIESIKDFI